MSDPRALPVSLSIKDRAFISNAWGLFNQALGDVALARRCFHAALEHSRAAGAARYTSTVLQNLADLERRAGALHAARRHAEAALRAAQTSEDPVELIESNAILGSILHALGDVQGARHHFTEALEHSHGRPLEHHAGLWHTEHLFQCGWVEEARQNAKAILRGSQRNGFHTYVTAGSMLLGLIVVDQAPQEAQALLTQARDWLERTKHIPQLTQAHLLAARLAIKTGDSAQARREVESGLGLAASCGFGLLHVDLLLCAAELELAEGHADASLRHADEALTRAAAPEAGDAWGEADALHWKGLALEQLGRRSDSRQALEAAAKKRQVFVLAGAEPSA
jgi:tetratricopeptide (TPR) repeat protein